MGSFSGYFKGEKKKTKKNLLERKAQILEQKKSFVLPKVEIIKKGKNEAEE